MSPSVVLSAGEVEYDDTGGTGPVLVLTHGLLMSGTVWRHVVPALAPRYRCIIPTLPLGAHRIPMHADADLTLGGHARLLEELLVALDLEDVTLVQNDWGPAQPLLGLGLGTRVIRLVLTSSEMFDNYPPRPARPGVLLARVRGGLWPIMWALQRRAVQRAPGSWGWLSRREVPQDVISAWMRPAYEDPRVRRDLAKYWASHTPRRTLVAWADRMCEFDGPVLVLWAREDRMMPPAHADELGRRLRDCRVELVDDSYTLLTEDQPAATSEAILRFLADTDR